MLEALIVKSKSPRSSPRNNRLLSHKSRLQSSTTRLICTKVFLVLRYRCRYNHGLLDMHSSFCLITPIIWCDNFPGLSRRNDKHLCRYMRASSPSVSVNDLRQYVLQGLNFLINSTILPSSILGDLHAIGYMLGTEAPNFPRGHHLA
jgi:hypothetical protein